MISDAASLAIQRESFLIINFFFSLDLPNPQRFAFPDLRGRALVWVLVLSKYFLIEYLIYFKDVLQ